MASRYSLRLHREINIADVESEEKWVTKPLHRYFWRLRRAFTAGGGLDELQYGEATRTKLREIMSTQQQTKLQLELAAILDIRELVRTTYQLEGDGLELLLVYDRIESLRSFGNAIRNEESVLPNVDALLRSNVKLGKRVRIQKYWEGYGLCKGEITSNGELCDSELYPGQQRRAYAVKYDVDGTVEDLEEEEVRPLLDISTLPERKAIIEKLLPAFDYLSGRVDGTCESQFSCAHMYEVCKHARWFNPNHARTHGLDGSCVDALCTVVAPLQEHVRPVRMKSEIPAYLSLAADFGEIPSTDPQQFTQEVLQFWRGAAKKPGVGEWCKAAQIVFAISPNSASCERVFSLLNCMFDDNQANSLADYLQAALMMRYNGRTVAVGES